MSAAIRLGDVAHARSGDKGDAANIGVIAWTAAGYEFLGRELTAERIAAFLHRLNPRDVTRYDMPGILAYNFLATGILAGGASRSLRIDSQGKVLALALLEMPLPRPDNFEDMLPNAD